MSEIDRIQDALVQAIRDSEGQKTFVINETPRVVLGCLVVLVTKGTIERVTNEDISVRTYRLKENK